MASFGLSSTTTTTTTTLLTHTQSNSAMDNSSSLPEETTTQPVTVTVPRVNSIQRLYTTKWIALDSYNWTDQDGRHRVWDVAVRTTTPATNTADAVVIIPILRSKLNPSQPWETLLVEQYRPPMQQTTLEFPAGLIDAEESVENAALRELREETGYVGEKCSIPPQVSRAVAMSPGMINEKVHVVVVEVDLDNPYNHDGVPKPELDDGEHCQIVRLPLTRGLKAILDDENNAMPIMGLYLFALGLELGSSLNA